MAKGWESKSVEEQQSLASQPPVSQEERERVSRERMEAQRHLQELELKRARVVAQMDKCTNERYRGMLQQEFDYLQAEIGKFNGSGH